MKVLYMEDAVANLKDTDVSPGKLIIIFQTTSFQVNFLDITLRNSFFILLKTRGRNVGPKTEQKNEVKMSLAPKLPHVLLHTRTREEFATHASKSHAFKSY